jgi:acetyltransferase EpsM
VIFDDEPLAATILGVPVKRYIPHQDTIQKLFISIGDPIVRKQLSRQFQVEYPSFVHASAVVYPSVKIGLGCHILPGALLDAEVILGNHCLVNNNATVSHNVTVGDYSHIAINAALSGGVKIGEGCLIGAGCVVLPEITIGNGVIVGAGAVVTKDLPDYSVVYGNPAKIVRRAK